MKNLKIKLGLFGLLAILVGSVFLTSCEQEQLTIEQDFQVSDESVVLENDIPNEFTYLLPYGYHEKSDDEINAYISSLNQEDINKLIENLRTAYYLESIGKLRELESTMEEGDILSVETLEHHLSPTEVSAFNSFNLEEEISVRGCTSWRYVRTYKSYYFWSYGCKEYKYYERECDGWDFWKLRFKSVFYRDC